jgi:uncharacterized membrane protein YtjA (UPF0391 family)
VADSTARDRTGTDTVTDRRDPPEVDSMAILELAIAFFVLAVIAGALGAGGVAGLSIDIAKWLVIVFLVLAVVSMVI